VTSQEQHVDVGAYVLGVLDDADASRFEAHLQYCAVCSQEFDSLAGLTPILAEFAQSAPDVQSLVARPSEGLLDNLIGEVAAKRSQGKRRRLYLVAAAAALIIAGPAVATVVTSDDGAGKAPSQSVIAGDVHSRTDPDTKVQADVGVQDKDWGAKVGLRLSNLKGPLKCDLVAISKTGEEQVVTTWSVPNWGYGINGRPPLEVTGGAAMKSAEIDRFEVRTLKGDRLVSVPVKA
jgi:hypothetical protein